MKRALARLLRRHFVGSYRDDTVGRRDGLHARILRARWNEVRIANYLKRMKGGYP